MKDNSLNFIEELIKILRKTATAWVNRLSQKSNFAKNKNFLNPFSSSTSFSFQISPNLQFSSPQNRTEKTGFSDSPMRKTVR